MDVFHDLFCLADMPKSAFMEFFFKECLQLLLR